MKIVNIVLSALILLLAIASAVFSYFLFEKRSQFVTGWGQLAQTISSASTELDQGSGTNYAQELTPQLLAHEKYSDLSSRLPKLIEQSKLVIKERDAMGEGLRRIGFSIRMKNLPDKKDVLSLDSYAGKISAIEGAVGETIEFRNRAYRNLVSFGKSEFGLTLKTSDLESGSDTPFTAMKNAIAVQREKVKAYERGLSRLAAELGIHTPEFQKFQTVTNEHIEKIRQQNNQKKTLEQQLDKLQKENVRLNSELKKSKALNDAQRQNIAKLNIQITDCKRALGIPVGTGKKMELWSAGSEEARQKLSGHVTEVSQEYGYVIIDLGSKSTVCQKIGKKLIDVPLDISSGMELVIMRFNEQKAPEFISRVTVDQVNPYSLTANIPAGSKTILVGDAVCYLKQDTGKASAEKVPAEKQAEPQKAAEKSGK